MTPQAELADQHDIQGTFLLSHLLTRELLNSDASYSYLFLHHV